MKQININVPKGYKLDEENSTFDCIKFKPILTYEEIEEKFKNSTCYIINNEKLKCSSSKQCKKIIAINKLINIADYLNNNYKGEWESIRHCISLNFAAIPIVVNSEKCVVQTNNLITNNTSVFPSIAYFKTKELAEEAIEILGEDTIRLIFS